MMKIIDYIDLLKPENVFGNEPKNNETWDELKEIASKKNITVIVNGTKFNLKTPIKEKLNEVD